MAVAPPSDSDSDASTHAQQGVRPDVTDLHHGREHGHDDPGAPVAFPGVDADVAAESTVRFAHAELGAEFTGVRHRLSTPDAEVHQYRGIKYARVPLRFRRSVLFDDYPTSVDATKFG